MDKDLSSPPKIAIIGSGITGLTAAWTLQNFADVHLYERHSDIGMAAFGVKYPIQNSLIEFDIPFRTIKRDYYPTLFEIYKQADIQTRKVDYSFRVESYDEPVFGFRSFSLFGGIFGRPTLDSFRTQKGRRIFKDLLKFYTNARTDWEKGEKNINILEFLKKGSYSDDFIYDFLLPTFSLVNTCKIETVAMYPAETIIGYHSRGYSYTPQETAAFGTRDIVNKLTRSTKNIHLSAKIQNIYLKNKKPFLRFVDHEIEFDHVILSTQANQAKHLLGTGYEKERDILEDFHYESSEVSLHTNKSFFTNANVSLVFKNRKNFDKPEVTLNLGRIIPELRGEKLYQTWNPHTLPADHELISLAKFERPTMNYKTKLAIESLAKIQSEKDRKLWLCGSYSLYGIPLLEAGAKSALQIANKIIKNSEANS